MIISKKFKYVTSEAIIGLVMREGIKSGSINKLASEERDDRRTGCAGGGCSSGILGFGFTLCFLYPQSCPLIDY